MKRPPSLKNLLTWQFAAFIILVLIWIFLPRITNSLPQVLKAFGDRQTTGYVYSKHVEYTRKGGSNNVLEVGFHDQNDELQFAHINVLHTLYPDKDPLAEKDPIQIVYNPHNASQAYVLNGQDLPDSWRWILIVATTVIFAAVFKRYKSVLSKKIF